MSDYDKLVFLAAIMFLPVIVLTVAAVAVLVDTVSDIILKHKGRS